MGETSIKKKKNTGRGLRIMNATGDKIVGDRSTVQSGEAENGEKRTIVSF